MPKNSTQLFVRPTLLALAAAACVSAIAQENAQTLSEVVVSASGFEQQIKDAPASISVVTREELEKKSFRDLADALSDVEGIDVKGGTGKTGGFDISIRGMPSTYTLILVDGRRTSAAGETTPNGFSASQTSLIPPLSAIERIEIVRGPMSTLYGSDAMGGVINIITRKVAKEWAGSLQLEGSIPENNGQGSAQKTSFYLNGPIKTDLLGIALRGNYFNRDKTDLGLPGQWKESNIKGVSPAKSDQYTIGSRLTLTPNTGQELWLDLETARTEYDNRACQLGNLDFTNCGTITDANGYRENLKFNRDQYAIGYKGRLDIGLFETSISHIINETKGRTLPTEAFSNTYSGNLKPGDPRKLKSSSTIWDTKLVMPLGEKNLLSIGSQYMHSVANDSLTEPSYQPSKFSQDTWAIFAENEWSITNDLVLTGGLRHDHHDKFGGHWTPRAYLVWNANEKLTFKGGISQGFRAPKINDLIDGVSSVGSQGTEKVFGNPNLKPEESTSTEFGAIFNNQNGFTSNITFFHSKFKNKIESEKCNAGAPIAACSRPLTDLESFKTNKDRATTHGFEVGSRYRISSAWNISANYTWTDSEVKQQGVVIGKFNNTPKHMANATINWNPSQKWSFWLQAEYRGTSDRFATKATSGNNLINQQREAAAAGEKLKAYSLFNFGTQYKANKNLTLSATIYNLLDKNFNKFTYWQAANGSNRDRWANPYFSTGNAVRGSMPEGRTLWLKANMQF